MLTCKGTVVNDNQLMYRASKYEREVCSLKPRCCPKEPARKVPRSIHEGARDLARDIAKTEPDRTSRRQRKKVEMLFAHLKTAAASRYALINANELKTKKPIKPNRPRTPDQATTNVRSFHKRTQKLGSGQTSSTASANAGSRPDLSLSTLSKNCSKPKKRINATRDDDVFSLSQ